MAKFTRDIEIDASMETVWSVLNNPKTWPHWFPGVDAISEVRGRGQGMTFYWQDDNEQGSGRVVEAEPNERLEISTQLGDDEDLHIFELKPDRRIFGLGKSGRTDVRYTLDTLSGGGILGRFISAGNPLDMRRVKSAMDRLKDYIEDQT